ncbi:MAG: hypothetical protein IJ404_02125 [Clostridia bacterium]|nr:hypothetical protein [Clostridia bacterium]
MKTKIAKWFHAAGIRALRTVSQTAIAMLGTSMLLSEVDWISLLSASVLSGLLSLLTSVAGLPELRNSEENEDEDN